MRRLLPQATIDTNIQKISESFQACLEFGDGPGKALLLNNDGWLSSLNYISFLRDYGCHFTVNRMLTFESVKRRLDREQALTFLEFNYMILQAYDYLYLYETYGCVLQMGGTDQWGNILNGIELIRRIHGEEVFGLTAPLITTANGSKMGKTAQGAVWLRKAMLSSFDFWQFWRNTHDADVGRFLRLFTELPLDEIQRLESLQGNEINEAKKILADEVTKLLHGEESVQEARETASQLYESPGLGEGGNLALPTTELSIQELSQGVPLVDLLCRVGLTVSKGEARRLIRGKGARLNDTLCEKEDYRVGLEDQGNNAMIKISAGRKKHALLKVCVQDS